MKKSEILNILKKKIENYYVIEGYLIIIVSRLNFFELEAVGEWILSISANDEKSLRIAFNSDIVID